MSDCLRRLLTNWCHLNSALHTKKRRVFFRYAALPKAVTRVWLCDTFCLGMHFRRFRNTLPMALMARKDGTGSILTGYTSDCNKNDRCRCRKSTL